ncbi:MULTISPECIES: hypothetical protein [unclassified Sphingomonas]|uniref:hypothetical protein n=1 Tax=unclassified Sphingomonas TaxID=196159 RepID=UPI000BCDEEBB|nr:MAG: hypothetical protein B7Z43_09000 [Sphingomonas sp. 12-62-6]OYX38463.1 MAG: hypothetical protein B7Y98_08315 [Sphingomonas sp. 32-62-10]
MNRGLRYGLVSIGALALLSLVHLMRGIDREWPPIVAYLMGVMPNIAAAIAIPFVVLGYLADQRKTAPPAAFRRWFYAAATVSLIGLIGWELLQRRSTGLIFDVDDIGATFVGTMIAVMLFTLVTPKAAD